MEEINLNLGSPNLNVSGNNSAGTIKINIDDSKPQKSVNFGPGAEMLMNPNKNKATSPRADINLSELNISVSEFNIYHNYFNNELSSSFYFFLGFFQVNLYLVYCPYIAKNQYVYRPSDFYFSLIYP